MNGGLEFREVLRLIAERRRVLIWAVCGTMLAGLLLAVLLRPVYEAKVVVAPASIGDLRGRFGGAGGLAGLADLAGLNIGDGGDVEKSLAILMSRRFTDAFLRDEAILPVLYKEQWDPVAGAWKNGGSGPLAAVRRALDATLRFLSGDQSPAGAVSVGGEQGGPPAWDAFRRFDDMRQVRRDRKTSLVTIAIRWRDPVLAAKWANDLVDRANDEARNIAVRESEERLQYLGKQLEVVQAIGLRDALLNVTAVEQKKAMLAHVQRAYAFQVIDPAVVAGERVAPKRTAIMFASLIVGLFLGFVLIVARAAWPPRR